MGYNLISVFAGFMLMVIGDKYLPNQVKEIYEDENDSWKDVLTNSRVASLLAGLLTVLTIHFTDMPGEYNPVSLSFASTVTAYITMQSIMTDFKVLLINRHILRLAYISLFVLGLYNTTNPLFAIYRTPVIISAIGLFIMFIFINIGASDIRALAVALPFSISIGGQDLSLVLLLISLMISIIIVKHKRHPVAQLKLEELKKEYPEILDEFGEKTFKEMTKKIIKSEIDSSEEYAVPVGPFMIAPLLLFLIIYPIWVTL